MSPPSGHIHGSSRKHRRMRWSFLAAMTMVPPPNEWPQPLTLEKSIVPCSRPPSSRSISCRRSSTNDTSWARSCKLRCRKRCRPLKSVPGGKVGTKCAEVPSGNSTNTASYGWSTAAQTKPWEARSSRSAVFCMRVLYMPWLKRTTGHRWPRSGGASPILLDLTSLRWLPMKPGNPKAIDIFCANLSCTKPTRRRPLTGCSGSRGYQMSVRHLRCSSAPSTSCIHGRREGSTRSTEVRPTG
mmetsp:Transcript_10679/g.29967  ORF Transcript_10679/g.29967 Transcript_10679/m.29967 type:complete len:241 (-) Transcript_10679:262-984(-)